MTLTIKFDEAEEYRKVAGCYLRKKQWEDLTIDVYLWYYTYYIKSRSLNLSKEIISEQFSFEQDEQCKHLLGHFLITSIEISFSIMILLTF